MLRILFICEHSPFKSQSGAHQRSSLLCNALSKVAHIDVFTLEQDKECNIDNCTKIDIKYDTRNNGKKSSFLRFFLLFIPPLLTMIFKLFYKFTIGIMGRKNYFLSRIIRKLRKKGNYDFVVVRGISNLRTFGISPQKTIILDSDDLPEQFYQSRVSLLKGDNSVKSICIMLYCSLCAIIHKHRTIKIMKKVLVAYLPNEKLCSLFENAVYLPNIPYQINKIEPKTKSKYQILFVGVIEYQPNYFGLEYFLDTIYPLVVENIHDVNFNIVGNISAERKTEWLKKYEKISLLGFVDDINKVYLDSSVVVVPVYNGSGTNIKVIEAMSRGKACVISSFAGKGYEDILVNGKNIFIAESNVDFAEKIVKLLLDDDLRAHIGESARESVDQRYSFENFSEIIIKSIPGLFTETK